MILRLQTARQHMHYAETAIKEGEIDPETVTVLLSLP
jgi:hypothetical protein